MTINQYELKKLLEDDIYSAHICNNETLHIDGVDTIVIEFGNFERVELEWNGGQEFFIINSTSDEMFPGCTISVDEILDIVL